MPHPMVDRLESATGRIGYVVKRYPRFSETFIVNEILAHESAGVDIDIFSLRPGVDTHFQDIIAQVRASVTYLPMGPVKSGSFWSECHRTGNRFPKLWQTMSEAKHATVLEASQAIELAREVRKRKIGHLHAHFATSSATVAQLAARIAGITYSVTMHAKDIFHESVVSEDLQSKIAESEFIVTVSDFNQQYLAAHFGFGGKIHRIYNGLDLSVFDYRPEPSPPRKIIAVGRLVPKKGFSHLIDACKVLLERQVEFACEILGNGELESDLKQQIAELSLGNHVRLIGPQPQNTVREMIRSAAVFAAPCVIGHDGDRDGLPTVITESLALGTPCVATDVTGIPEIIRHGVTGLIVEQENAVALANGIQRLLDDHDLRRTISANARQLIESEFDIHSNVARIREHFPSRKHPVAAPHILKYQRA